MEHTDSKPRKLKPIGQSFHVIFNRKQAEADGFKEDELVEVTIKKKD